MSTYPTRRDYRAPAGGTVRVPLGPRPNRPRRKPGRPPARMRPVYRPAGVPVRVPAVPKALQVPGFRLQGFLGKLGPYGLAFEVGYMLGLWLFASREQLLIRNPGNWEEYICPGYGDGGGGPLQESSTRYPQVLGSSGSNCISGQFVAGAPTPGDEFGVWEDYGVFLRRRHVVTFGHAGATDPAAVPDARWGNGVVQWVDPVLEEFVGPLIWLNPLLSPIPVGTPGIGPVAPPLSARARPSPGVGTEGYISGQPSLRSRARPRTKGDPNPKRARQGTKEVKTRAERLYKAIGDAYGQITEAEDLLDVMQKSLDSKCARKAQRVWVPGGDTLRWQRVWNGKFLRWEKSYGQYRNPSFMEKFNNQYKNHACMDMAEFWKNYIDNQAQDVVTSGAHKKRKPLRPTLPGLGVEFGPAL